MVQRHQARVTVKRPATSTMDSDEDALMAEIDEDLPLSYAGILKTTADTRNIAQTKRQRLVPTATAVSLTRPNLGILSVSIAILRLDFLSPNDKLDVIKRLQYYYKAFTFAQILYYVLNQLCSITPQTLWL